MCVVLALVPQSSAASRKILVDLSHEERIMEGEPCFDLFTNYLFRTSERGIQYRTLQDYDILFVGIPQESFNPSEIEAIAQFVSNGGGLLLVAEPPQDVRGARSQYINSLSEFFGCKFSDAMILGDYGKTQIYSQSHPVLVGVSEINWAATVYLTVTEPAEEVLHHEGKCMVACCEYGRGRVIFLSDSDLFTDQWVYKSDNNQFASNIFQWLSEPGGPYLQAEEFLDKGVVLMDAGREQLESGEFSQAESTLQRSKNYLETASTMYESDAAVNLIETVESLIADTETGTTAEALLQEGAALYESGDYVSAASKLQEAQQLFQSINVENEECTSLLQECEMEMGSTGVREHADILFSEGVTSFEKQQYERAKAKFEEALLLFTELQDSEKIEECNEWITSCEEFLDGESPITTNVFLVGAIITIMVSAVVGGWFTDRG